MGVARGGSPPISNTFEKKRACVYSFRWRILGENNGRGTAQCLLFTLSPAFILSTNTMKRQDNTTEILGIHCAHLNYQDK